MSPYLTAYVLHVYKTAVGLNYTVSAGVRDRAYDYLERELAAPPPVGNEEWWPSYTAWQAFAVKVLAEGGRAVDAHLTRLYGYRERMPVFALAYLHDALVAKGDAAKRPRRRSAAAHDQRDSARGAAVRTWASWPIRICCGSGTPTCVPRPSCSTRW